MDDESIMHEIERVESDLLDKPNWKEVMFAAEWRSAFDELADVYVLSDEQENPYVSVKLLTPESRDRSVFGADERMKKLKVCTMPMIFGRKEVEEHILRKCRR